MIRLEDLQSNAALRGILRDALVTAVNVQWYGNPPPEFTVEANHVLAVVRPAQ